jgi:succinyl-CoA synthetase alpha subunit
MALNDTEEAVKANKIAMIESLFNAKRQVIRALGAMKAQHSANMALILNQTAEHIENALEATVNGISFSKNFAAEIAAEITIGMFQYAQSTHATICSAITQPLATLLRFY